MGRGATILRCGEHAAPSGAHLCLRHGAGNSRWAAILLCAEGRLSTQRFEVGLLLKYIFHCRRIASGERYPLVDGT